MAVPWDYTLYRGAGGTYILKVVFSAGDYKVDVSRYFVIDHGTYGPLDLRALSATIRAAYPDVPHPEVDKANLRVGPAAASTGFAD